MRVKCHLCGVILCVRAHPRGEAQVRGERSSVVEVTQVGPEGPRKERYLIGRIAGVSVRGVLARRCHGG